MVAASKLRRAQDAATGPKDYTVAARDLLQRLGSSTSVHNHPFFQVRKNEHTLTILIAGDRGMAGAYNSNTLKALVAHMKSTTAKQSAICVGRHAALQIANASDINEVAAYDMDGRRADFGLAQPILREAVELFRSGNIDSVQVVYTKFVSTVRQEVVLEQILPVTPPAGLEHKLESELEPEPEILLDFAIMRLLEAQVLQAILEARASEQASRMLAMMNATDNAKELITDLTLSFNNARQAAITQELAEISAGAEAIND